MFFKHLAVFLFTQQLHRVVKRDAELKLQKISQHYEEKCQQLNDRFVMPHPTQQRRQLRVQDEKRMKNIEKVLETMENQMQYCNTFPPYDQTLRQPTFYIFINFLHIVSQPQMSHSYNSVLDFGVGHYYNTMTVLSENLQLNPDA